MPFRRWLILTHRYLGIALCLLFAMWFLSGIAMIYARDMPRLTPSARLQHLPPLDLARVRIPPAQAAEQASLFGARGPVSLVTILGRPAYRFSGRDTIVIYADTGEPLGPIGDPESLEIASQFTKRPKSDLHHLRIIDEADQWTIGERRQLPLHKIAVDDGLGTELYISEQSGEVAVATTRGTRALAWIAAIPHWLYFAPLRINDALWRRTVLWASGLGIVSAFLGLLLAWTQYRVQYTGLLRWHYISGVTFGVFTLTWVFSGMLSMEPWFWASNPGAADDVPSALSGGPMNLSGFPAIDPDQWASAVQGHTIKQIDFSRIQGEPYLVARGDTSMLLAAAGLKERSEGFSVDAILQRVKGATSRPEVVQVETLSGYDAYYYDRDHEAPLPVARIKLGDPDRTWIYVDLARSEMVASFTRRARIQRWIYHGLHSLDFPIFYDSRPLWDAVVIALCSGGAALSLIGVVLAARRVSRALPDTLAKAPASPRSS